MLGDLNRPFDVERFLVPHHPINVGVLSADEQRSFFAPGDARNVLDLPIVPGSDFRLPMEYAQWAPVVQRIADAEWALNPTCYDEYYCYLTLRREHVEPGDQGTTRPATSMAFKGALAAQGPRQPHVHRDQLPADDVLPAVLRSAPARPGATRRVLEMNRRRLDEC